MQNVWMQTALLSEHLYALCFAMHGTWEDSGVDDRFAHNQGFGAIN